jgi:exonuclease SbcD
MRVLHTSDWHLGNVLHEHHRVAEEIKFLDWIYKKIVELQVDVLVISGDIFDTTAPGNLVQERYYRFLASIIKSNCQHVIVVGGNHDLPSQLNAPSEILKAINIQVVASAKENVEDEVFVLTDNNSNNSLIVGAVPFLREADVRKNIKIEDLTIDCKDKLIDGIKAHYAIVADKIKDLRASLGQDIPAVVTGHLYTVNGKLESDDGVRTTYQTMGNLQGVGSDCFSSEFDYIALGHLHLPQKVNNQDNIRYCGTPYPMGFGEAGQDKFVILVDFEGRKPIITEVKVPSFQELVSVKGNFAQIKEQIEELKLKNSSAWIEVVYNGEENILDLANQVRSLLKDSSLELLKCINKQVLQSGGCLFEAVEKIESLSVEQIFERRLSDAKVLEEEKDILKACFNEVLETLNQEGLASDIKEEANFVATNDILDEEINK